MSKVMSMIGLMMVSCWIVPPPLQAQQLQLRGILDPSLGPAYGKPFQYYQWTLLDDKSKAQAPDFARDGNDFSNQTFNHMIIDSGQGDLLEYIKNVNFSGCRFNQVYIVDYDFIDCDFSVATFYDVQMLSGVTGGCNFADAWINNSRIHLMPEQLLSTASYKAKNLVGFDPGYNAFYQGMSFAGFDLRYCDFQHAQMIDCDFTDATIEGATLGHLRIEQLLETKDFKQGLVKGVKLSMYNSPTVWPDHVVDLSNMVFIDCEFGLRWHTWDPVKQADDYHTGKVDLTDSVISGCHIGDGITLENIKSTWNYKHNRMEGIKLPKEIQEALDAEKQQQ